MHDRSLDIALISVHGLIRGEQPELGRDADTGGQVRYVLELARALSDHPRVARVELLTRQILALNLAPDYARHVEQIAERAWIVRLPCGPHRYLRKEALWSHLPDFVDHVLQHFRNRGRVPDVVHSHYADAGTVAVRLGRLLGVPLIHTGHSLGRDKRQRLLDSGLTAETIERRYNISRRIQAEEDILRAADLVVASTEQEVDEQWARYETRARSRLVVIPPGVDISRFRPPRRSDRRPPFGAELDRFLADPAKPLILAVQRADERKNLATLLRAFGSNTELRELANLALLIGSRDDLTTLDSGARRVLRDMLLEIDRLDLYGSVAYPKHHSPDDVPELYRLAARRRGVFVNPALTEPFGLTLIEAAASGLPIVATNDGGPRTIVSLCHNGELVDPLDADQIGTALLTVLSDRRRWRRLSRAGVRGANRHFSWQGHARRYISLLDRILGRRRREARPAVPRDRMVVAERLLVCDLEDTLSGDSEGLAELRDLVNTHRGHLAFGVATGRTLTDAGDQLERSQLPVPDLLITSVGTEIYYRHPSLVQDRSWRRTIDHHWDRRAAANALTDVPGLRLQPDANQSEFKLSYFTDRGQGFEGVREVRRRLRAARVRCRVVHSLGEYLDVVPVRASIGRAVRFVLHRWGFDLEHLLVAGGSGNSVEMLRLGAPAVVVANRGRELQHLRDRPDVLVADASHARGILEGIRHFNFLPAPTADHEENP